MVVRIAKRAGMILLVVAAGEVFFSGFLYSSWNGEIAGVTVDSRGVAVPHVRVAMMPRYELETEANLRGSRVTERLRLAVMSDSNGRFVATFYATDCRLTGPIRIVILALAKPRLPPLQRYVLVVESPNGRRTATTLSGGTWLQQPTKTSRRVRYYLPNVPVQRW